MIEGHIRQLSLVAFLGDYHPNNMLLMAISSLQDTLERYLPGNFQKYLPRQLHSTIIGLEAARFKSSFISKAFLENQHQLKKIDLLHAFKSIKHSELLPVKIRFGGFDDQDFTFTSRGVSPFFRSFTIQNNIAAIMGWPFIEKSCEPVLDSLRRSFIKYGLLHKYHTTAEAIDNDFYMVIGNISQALDKEEIDNIQRLMRKEMKIWHDINLKLTPTDLRVVAYKDTKFVDIIPYTLDEAIADIPMLYAYYPGYGDAINRTDWLV